MLTIKLQLELFIKFVVMRLVLSPESGLEERTGVGNALLIKSGENLKYLLRMKKLRSIVVWATTIS